MWKLLDSFSRLINSWLEHIFPIACSAVTGWNLDKYSLFYRLLLILWYLLNKNLFFLNLLWFKNQKHHHQQQNKQTNKQTKKTKIYLDFYLDFLFFSRHELVKNLKHKLDELVSPLIDEELEKYSTAGHIDSGSQETLVTRITKSVTQSKQYEALLCHVAFGSGFFQTLSLGQVQCKTGLWSLNFIW